MRVLIVGEASLARRCAEFLLGQSHRVVAIATPDAGLASWAGSKGIPTTAQTTGLDDWAKQFEFDVLFSIVNGLILPDGLLEQPKLVGLNFHDGPLPRYSGFNSTSWALFNRESTYGVTWHEMKSKLDAGDIYEQEIFDISPGETAFTLNAKCFDAGYRSFERLAGQLASGAAKPRPQDFSQRTYCKRFDRPYAGGLLDFGKSADELEALGRGLDFGTYVNPMGLAKIYNGSRLLGVRRVKTGSASTAAPGTVISAAGDVLTVATAGGRSVELEGLVELDGSAPALLPPAGSRLPQLPAEDGQRLTEWINGVSRHEPYWVDRIASAEPAEPGLAAAATTTSETKVAGTPAQRVAALVATLARWVPGDRITIGFSPTGTPSTEALVAAPIVPLTVELRPSDTFADLSNRCDRMLKEVEERRGFARDLTVRHPRIRNRKLTYGVVLTTGAGAILPSDGQIVVRLLDQSIQWLGAQPALPSAFNVLLDAGIAKPETRVSALPVIAPEERAAITAINATESSYDQTANLAQLFAAQAARTGDRVALQFEDESLTYRELDQLSNRWARILQSKGAGPGQRVGIAMERSVSMVVALMAVLKTGAAYVPLDPAFPKDRLLYMAEDAELVAIASDPTVGAQIPRPAGVPVVLLHKSASLDLSDGPIESAFPSSSIAYVIYTSGSTGKPKGVMVTHRNVVSFFHGMDQKLQPSNGGVWLAVTSISFDISVLELFWTLTRGFTVVIQRDPRSSFGSTTATKSDVDFSLYYFAADIGHEGDRYRMLLEGARFADQNGFLAVWTPERHFHNFGGLYPNPSVTSAALAVTTKNVRIRAGSVVLPLHHPARVAEEWSVVDNLSGGRVGISFASGWNARDFVFAPQNYADAKKRMFEMIRQVQQLWRGEKVAFPDGKGEMAEIGILPPPVQKELPFWVTTAGNPETFRLAGESGGNLLTHLLGQTFDDLSGKIAAYREARRAAGHPGPGTVTLLLHTFVGEDREEVRGIVREPLIQYLKTSADLIKKAVEQFPAFQRRGDAAPANVSLESLTQEEQDAIMAHAFQRYFETSGLFGTVVECVDTVRKAKASGVNEIACLIDFGIDPDRVLSGLTYLDEVRRAFVRETNYSIAAQIDRYEVTHLQCTPSYARMLTLDSSSRESLSKLQHMLVGGEALPGALAGELVRSAKGAVWNMYGPTETTVWSTTHRIDGDATPPIGRPLANQQTFILDRFLQPVPPGVAGELYIGGEGVTPGYWKRPDLTAERFVKSPLSAGPLYKTGDLVRLRPDGNIEFLGRTDFQVKIRGNRIELGEIESQLLTAAGVKEAAVVALPSTQGDPQLVAFVASKEGESAAPDKLRSALRASLPEIMVPSEFVELPALPKTPNGKIDRNALAGLRGAAPVAALNPPEPPKPTTAAAAPRPAGVATSSIAQQMEAEISGIWAQSLGIAQVNPTANFFDLGGHSLLAIQVHAAIKEKLQIEFSLVDLFELPTVRSLAGRLAAQTKKQNEPTPTAPGPVTDRAQMRREMMQRRLGK